MFNTYLAGFTLLCFVLGLLVSVRIVSVLGSTRHGSRGVSSIFLFFTSAKEFLDLEHREYIRVQREGERDHHHRRSLRQPSQVR